MDLDRLDQAEYSDNFALGSKLDRNSRASMNVRGACLMTKALSPPLTTPGN